MGDGPAGAVPLHQQLDPERHAQRLLDLWVLLPPGESPPRSSLSCASSLAGPLPHAITVLLRSRPVRVSSSRAGLPDGHAAELRAQEHLPHRHGVLLLPDHGPAAGARCSSLSAPIRRARRSRTALPRTRSARLPRPFAVSTSAGEQRAGGPRGRVLHPRSLHGGRQVGPRRAPAGRLAAQGALHRLPSRVAQARAVPQEAHHR